MLKENIHRPAEVIYKKVDECPLTDQQFGFFQMAYVISGSGKLSMNGNRVDYWGGNLMLLTPNDYHNFEITTTTEFLLVRFNSAYIKEYRWKSIDHIECLLYYASHLSGCIMKNERDWPVARSIVDLLLQGIRQPGLYNEDLTTHLINSLIVIAARNIALIKPANIKVNTDKRVLDIIDYIQANICYPEKLKAATIGEVFGISETYLGSYFKSQCGETIQHYIANYKLRLIEHRLKFSDRRINEIAAEFGFADESHLNKFFKKHRNSSLSAFRKSKEVYQIR